MTKIYNDLSKFFFSLQISVLIFLIPTNSLVIIDLKNYFGSNTVFMRVLSEIPPRVVLLIFTTSNFE